MTQHGQPIRQGNAAFSSAIDSLRSRLGPRRVLTEWSARIAVAHGTWPVEMKWLDASTKGEGPQGLPFVPGVVVRPGTTEEVAITLQTASRAGVRVVPFGGGSGIVGGTIADESTLLLDLKDLRYFQLRPIDLELVAGAGWNWSLLEEKANLAGYSTGHYPQSLNSATVGGMVATNGIGTFSNKYGKIDDLVTWLEVVLADGSVIETSKAPKGSTGPDLKRLFIGSEGTMGVVTRVGLKVWQLPEKRRVEGFALPGTVAGLEAVRQLFCNETVPALIRLYDEAESEHFRDALGLNEGESLLVIGHEGSAANVAFLLEMCDQYLCQIGARPLGEKAGRLWFAGRFNTSRMLLANRNRYQVSDAIEVAAPWGCLPRVWQAMKEAAAKDCFRVDGHFSHFYHTGGSVYIIFYSQVDREADCVPRYHEIVERLLDASIRAGGNSSHHHGIGVAKVKVLARDLGTGYEVLQRIKEVLDPAGILAPGNLGLGVSPIFAHANAVDPAFKWVQTTEVGS